MAAKVYLGRLPPGVQKGDVEDYFKDFRIRDIRLMDTFGFVEFDQPRDAEDAIRDFNGRPLLGTNISVEPTRERRREPIDHRAPPRGPPRQGVRISVTGFTGATSWQDLKDYGRLGGNNIIYADVDKYNPGKGVIEYPTMEEATEAITRLAGVDINGAPVTLEIMSPDSYERRPVYDRRPPPRDYVDDRRPPRGYSDRPPFRDSRDYYDRAPRGDPYEDRRSRGDYYNDRRDDRYARERSPRRDYPPRGDYPPRNDYPARGGYPARDSYSAREDYPARDDDRGRDDVRAGTDV